MCLILSLIFCVIALPLDPVFDWVDIHHWFQKDSPLLLPKTQVSRFFFLPGGRVSGVVPLANHWNAGGELWLCAFIQVRLDNETKQQGCKLIYVSDDNNSNHNHNNKVACLIWECHVLKINLLYIITELCIYNSRSFVEAIKLSHLLIRLYLIMHST